MRGVGEKGSAREVAPRPRQHANRPAREEHGFRRGKLHAGRECLEGDLEAPVPLALAAVVGLRLVHLSRRISLEPVPSPAAGSTSRNGHSVAVFVKVSEVDPAVAPRTFNGHDPELAVRIHQHAVHRPGQDLLVHCSVAPGSQGSESGLELGRARGERRGVQVVQQRRALEVRALNHGP